MARSQAPGTLATVKRLLAHPDFSMKNPNKVRSLIGAFLMNVFHFHAGDGSGYEFLADRVLELDAMNPQMAARLVSAFNPWRKYDPDRQALMKARIEEILGAPGLSRGVYEIASRALA